MTMKAPAEKLPLGVRKNVRDEWENKKPEVEAKISHILGETWTVATNPNLLFVYADESYQSRIGSVISWYMDPFCDNLETFVKAYGDDGKSELNSLCPKHEVELAPQDDTKFTYGGLQIKNGVLRLVFAEGSLAANVSGVSRDFQDAIKSAANDGTDQSAFNIIARNSVRKDYDPEIGKVQEAIGKLVGVPNLKLTPSFEANAAALAKAGSQVRSDWDTILGSSTLSYFQGLQYQLECAGFKDDDLLQEGWQEGISANEVSLRVVDKLVKGTYNETLVENGVLVIQTVPAKWWTNVNDVGSKILDQL